MTCFLFLVACGSNITEEGSSHVKVPIGFQLFVGMLFSFTFISRFWLLVGYYYDCVWYHDGVCVRVWDFVMQSIDNRHMVFRFLWPDDAFS